MKTFTARLLSFIFLINAVFLSVSAENVFAAEKAFNFQWNSSNTLDDRLNIVDKGTKYDNVFLWWDFGVRNGMAFDSGTYTLSYNIQNGRRVDFEVERQGAKAIVKYKVWDYTKNAYIGINESLYQVYKDTLGAYIAPNATDLPPVSESYGVNYNDAGLPEEVSFTIMQNTGFCFKFDNKTVRFQWISGTGNDIFYYETDGVTQGNIYDFDLGLNIPGEAEIKESLQIFTGINASSLTSTPYANDRTFEIDHTTRPYVDDDPGTEPEIVVEFDMPKVWDSTTNTYAFMNPSSVSPDDITAVILDLGNADDKRKIQVSVGNIYAADLNSVTTSSVNSGGTVNVSRTGSNRISIDITKLEPGVIFNPSEISLYKPNNSDFLANITSIEHGKVYTYPVFTVEAMSAEQFYLKIQPYEGYKGYYTVKSGSTAATLSNWAQVEDSKGGTEPIYVPVNLNAINKQTQFFQVDFAFSPPDSTPGTSQITLSSQILKFTPADSDVVISTPGDFEVVSAEVVPSEDDTKSELVMDLSWNMAYVEVIKNIIDKNGGSLDVYYDFNRGEVPYDENEERFAEIKLHITKNGDSINIECTDEEGKVQDFKWETYEVLIGTTKYTQVRPTVTFRLPAASKEEANEQFVYPNVYFLNVEGYYYDNTTYIKIPASLYDDVTLDDVVDIDVPQPQNVSIVRTGENAVGLTDFTVTWSNLDAFAQGTMMNQYMVKMLNSRNLGIGDKSVKFNAYITQDKSLFDELMKYDDDRESTPENIKALIKTHDFEDKFAKEGIDAQTAMASDGVALREHLRNGQIVCVENIMQELNAENQSLKISGLDKNQDYYVILETVVIPFNETENVYIEDEKDHSDYSAMVTATTLPDPDVPGPEDNLPKAPENFDKDNITLNSVRLFWDKVTESLDDDSNASIEYQFIRINGEKMSDVDAASRKDFAETWNKVKGDVQIAGWQTGGENIYEFDGNEFSKTPADTAKFGYDIPDLVINRLYDKTLRPNQLYFYYLRTVKIIDGKPASYSVWVPLSVTTTPVQGPENLKVERKIKHDEETEAVVSFDVPYFNIELLGTDYELQYSIKEDNQTWGEPITMNSSELTSKCTQNADGSLHFIYTIDRLKNGTFYSIRVRLLDKNLNEASAYSNIVQVRTELDQDIYDRDEDIKDWVDRYKELMEELLDDPYWIIEDNTAKTTVYYRPKQFGSVIGGLSSSVIELPVGEYGAKKIYYFPASAVKQAYDANKGFKISWKNSDVIIGARAIDLDLNDAVRNVIERIDNKHVDDYFVRISAYFNEVSYDIDGEKPLSPVIDVQVEAVGTDKNIQDFDDEMVNYLVELIIDEAEDSYEDIRDELDDDSNNEEMVKLLKDLLEDFYEDFYDETLDELDDILDRTYASAELQSTIIIAHAIAAGTSVVGKMQNGGIWSNINAMDYMGKKAIYTKKPGIYAFSGRVLSIPGITDVPNGSVITNLVAKYGLDDYLGKGNSLNLNAVLTRSMAVGCAARLAGAPNTADPTAFFASKGIVLTSRNAQGPISVQEAVYLAMMAYQARTNTKVDSIQIRNYNLTSGINGIQTNYKKSVQAAFETGIYTNQGMNPNGTMTVNEFLQMLANMSSKANLR